MKVLHVIGGLSSGGGAEKGVLNLHYGLQTLGVESIILHGRLGEWNTDRKGIEKTLSVRVKGMCLRRWDIFQSWLYGVPKLSSFSLGWRGYDIRPSIEMYKPDLLHIHWPHQAVIDFELLRYVKIPIVWTMRDFWAFTGGCHYALGCRKFVDQCNYCPYITRMRWLNPTKYLLNKKYELYKSLNIHFIALSPWEENLASSSKSLHGLRLSMIPNCVDIKMYQQTEQNLARKILGLPIGGIIYAVGAQDMGIGYKGPGLIKGIHDNLPGNCYMISFGKKTGIDNANDAPSKKWRHFGFIKDSEKLSLIYSAADVFICTSREEVFGKTVIESLACGTPAVVFREGGIASLIEREEGIEIADNHTVDAFLEAAKRLVIRKNRGSFRKYKLRDVVERYDNTNIAKIYKRLYEAELTANHKKSGIGD